MLIIVYPEIYGVHGIARYVQSYLANLNPDTTTVVLIAVPNSERHILPDYVRLVEIPMAAGRGGLLQWSIRARRVIRQLLDTPGLHTVNLQVPPLIPALIAPPRKAHVTVVAHTTYYGMSGEYYGFRYFPGQWGRLSILVKKAMERRIFHRADRIVTLTEQGNAELRWYGCHDKIITLPNGVDLQNFSPDGASDTAFDVLFVGRIEQRKGSRPLVAVCRQLVTDMPNIRIGIVGDGDDFEYVTDQLAPMSSNIKLLGRRSFQEVKHFYSTSLIYASTSYYEGLPGTCLEAMAMGLPAVVWDLPFYRGLVLPEQTGTLVPIDDAAAFSRSIQQLLGNPDQLQSLGHAARQLITSQYDWAKLADRISSAISLPARV